MTQHELDNDLPAYLVFLILANIRKLKQVQPDHILVKAVEHALDQAALAEKSEDGRTGHGEITLCERAVRYETAGMQAMLVSSFVRKALRLDEADQDAPA